MVKNELACRALGVDCLAPEIEHAETRATILDGLKPLHDLPKSDSRASQLVDLADGKRIAPGRNQKAR
jgi:hypothetical protein